MMDIYSLHDAIPHDSNSIITVGTFDGVHKGHQFIIDSMLQLKHQMEHARTVVVTFDPHPQTVIPRKDKPPIALLSTISERLQLLESYGIDMVVIIPFTIDFAQTSSEEFIRTYIHGKIGASDIFIGYDHGFGKAREGGADTLHSLSKELNFTVHDISPVVIEEKTVSSTEIRRSLKCGNLLEAFEMLGHPYFIEGTVVKGDQRGRTIGFPTANINPNDEHKLLPHNGVYFVSSDIDGRTVYGMANIGIRPTVSSENKVTIEVHFFEIDQDLYDATLVIWFLKYIREEQAFSSLDDLKKQLHKDESLCKTIIQSLDTIEDN
jgi:riboflavin kinase/FMN adenylyltransferase